MGQRFTLGVLTPLTARSLDATLYQSLQHGATLLTASRYLAHALQQDFATQARASGLTVWPTPRILPWNTYLRVSCQQHRESSRLRLLSDAQTLALWERLVADSNEGSVLLNPAQAARHALRSWQHLHQYQINVSTVAAYPSDEAQALVSWSQKFSAQTAQRHWLDSARFADYLREHEHQPDAPLSLMGFTTITPQMQALLTHYGERGVAVHIAPMPTQHAQIRAVTARDAEDELGKAARWARERVEAGCQRVAVVVASLDAQAPLIERTFSEVFAPAQRGIDITPEPLAFNVIHTPALTEQPLVQHALWLLQLAAGRADVRLVGQVLRSPFIAGFADEASARALLDIDARERRQTDWDCGALQRLAQGHTSTPCHELAALMQGMSVLMKDWRAAALPSAWTERFTQLLTAGGWPRGRTLSSHELQVQNKFRQVLGELSALDELMGPLTIHAALTMVRDACRAERFAPQRIDQAVTVLDVDNLMGLSVDALWVTGLHAGAWPPTPAPDAFIPIEVQAAARMPQATASLVLQHAEQQLRGVLTAATEVVVSWPAQDGDEALRASALLDAWPCEPWGMDDAPVGRAAAWFAHRPPLERYGDSALPALDDSALAGATSGGSRLLELQSRCPFRAQAEWRLHARPIPDISKAIEADERGTLVHVVLQEVWQQLKTSTALRHANWTQLAESVREMAQRLAAQKLSIDTPYKQRLAQLEIELCTQWVMQLLQLDAEREPFTVQQTEQREHIDLAGLSLRIQLDRMDELADGSRLLIDYKTGDSHRSSHWLDRERNRPRSPQLPLYALAHRAKLAGIAFAVLTPKGVQYRGLAREAGIAPGIEDYASQRPNRRLDQVDDWEQLLDRWQQVLTVLAQNFRAGRAEVEPLLGECKYCHLQSLCRIRELADAAMDDSAMDDTEQSSHE